MTRRVLATLIVTAAAFVLIARADGPAAKDDKPKVDPGAAAKDAAARQDRLARQFKDFEDKLLRLAQRMEDSKRAEDKQKAVILRKAIQEANKSGVDTKFDRLVKLVQDSKTFEDLEEITKAIDFNKQLIKDIQDILEILLTDNRDEELRKKQREIAEMIRRLNQIIRDEHVIRAWTDRKQMDPNKLGDKQKDNKDATKAVAKGDGNKGDGKNAKANSKGEGKNAKGAKGEGKNDTKEAKIGDKSGEGKEGGNKEGKEGSGKEGKGGEGKEGKAGEGKGGDGKEGKGGDSKAGDKKGEGKPGDGKPGEGKPGEAKDAKPAAGKGEGKPGSGKPGEGKPGQGKGASKGKGDGKGSGKPGEGKGGKPSDGKGGKAGESKGGQGGMGGMGGQGGEGSGKGAKQPPQPPKPPQDGYPGRKQIEDAIEAMKKAEEKIRQRKNDDAAQDETEAIKKLEDAKKKLEELLRQLRQEEIERLLAKLQQRCERMLALQIAVRGGTVKVAKDVDSHDGKKPDRSDQQAANKLSDDEDVIVREANQAIQILESEGSAVAFPFVFKGVRDDMISVSRRLRTTDVGKFTVRLEDDIIQQLKEMIEALKQARKENQKPPPPPPPGNPPPTGPQDQPLLKLVQELKLIRSMQIQVNKRTVDWAKEYSGDQAPDPSKARTKEERDRMENVQKETKNLGERQKEIADITDSIAKGKNK